MQELDDIALLRQFAAGRSEAAFEQLVARHAGFVHSAALRQVRDPQWAAEITQAVFLILARKAAHISDKTILTGWLFKTTRFVALAQVRAEVKRRQHEKETLMQTRLQTEPSSDAGDQAWAELAPLLDQALAQLGDTDRQAVLLRYFESKSLAEVGNKLGTGEDTARKRVSRALEKLRKFFAKHRVIYSTAIIAGAISANAVQAAPSGLVAAIPGMALKGSAISSSTLALVKEALNLMTMAKIQTAALVAAAAILATGGTVVVSRVVAQESQTLRPQSAQSGPLTAGNQLASNAGVQTSTQTSLSEPEVRELARLRDEVGRLRGEDARLRRQTNFLAKAQSTTNPPGIGETVWFINSSNDLAALPPVFILRPTHFTSSGGGGGGGPLTSESGGEIGEGSFFGRWAAPAGGDGIIPILARNISLAQMMAKAFAVDLDRVVSPPDAPTDHFDLLMTGPDATKEKLKAEIKSRLGCVAHIESRPTDVLLLTLSQAGATGLLPATSAAGAVVGGVGGGGGFGGRGGGGSMRMNYPGTSIANLVKRLQSFFQQPIVDRTGLTGDYNVSLNTTWEVGTTRQEALTQALSDQVGLTLTPSTVPLDLLMVQVVKEAAPLPSLPTENQLSSNVAAKSGAQASLSEQPGFELARLRDEAVRLRDEVAQLRQLTDEMVNAQSSTNSLVIDENVWSIHSSGDLAKLPPAFILRPTQFANDNRKSRFGIRGKRGLAAGGGFFGERRAPTSEDSPMQVLAPNISFTQLMATAFDVDAYKLVIPPSAPAGGFDLLMTGPDATRKRLQAAIKSQLGYVAHFESRPTNVLLLTLRQAGAPGLQPSKATTRGGPSTISGGTWHFVNQPISNLVSSLQRNFDPPIIDRSGLTGKFDISLNFGTSLSDAILHNQTEGITSNLTEQLGLSLTPGIEPLDLLVVEADKAN